MGYFALSCNKLALCEVDELALFEADDLAFWDGSKDWDRSQPMHKGGVRSDWRRVQFSGLG